jgi:membrane-bound inhibitor of C-type lysozyme
MKLSSLLSGASAALLMTVLPAGQSLAGDPTADSGWHQVNYICESGEALNVAFRESGSAAQVTAADKPTLRLMGRPARSGFRYSDDRYELRGEGVAVTWKIGTKTPVKCASDGQYVAKVAAAVTR